VMQDLKKILMKTAERVLAAIGLTEDSIKRYRPYDPSVRYTSRQLEPYDALSDRFVRSVEMCFLFFRIFERHAFGDVSETYRDNLNPMEKLGAIRSADLWLEMRHIQNRPCRTPLIPWRRRLA